MARFRTIRQRRHRARRGQVSAVATVLGLLLVVIFVSSFILDQIPNQMGQLEFDHVNQVQNQLSRLQATILAQSERPNYRLNLVSPVTLGSGSVPPFSQPSTGSIAGEAPGISSLSWFALGQVFPHEPNWNVGTNPCASGTVGTPCASNNNTQYWNLSGLNHTSLNIKVSGGNNGLVYNFTGNNDTITLTWNGKDTTFIRFVVNGSNNVVNYIKSGSDTGRPSVAFYFYGENNVFTFSPAGSHSSGGAMGLLVSFVGTNGNTCPYSNASLTNRVGTLGTGGSNINMSVVWWNAVGYVTPVHRVAYPGGAIPTETLRWSNQSAGFVECAFSSISSSSYGSSYQGGVDVHLFNRYSPQADVVYEAGGVLLAQVGGTALMVSPPLLNVTRTTTGLTGQITLINLLTNFVAQGGIQTAGLSTIVTQVNTVTLTAGFAQTYISTPFYYNVTTLYPSAWLSYMGANPSIFPYGGTCSSAQSIPAPYTCALPPAGVAVTVSGALLVQSLTVTTITVQLTIS